MDNIKIKFKGLKEGKYKYSFQIKNSFFDKYPEGEIKKGNIKVDINMNLSKELTVFSLKLSGSVKLVCDRCLDVFDNPINYNAVLYVEFGEKDSDISDADTKITLSKEKTEIVLDKHIYDYINLSLPYKRIHPADKNGNTACNIKMIEKLNEYSYKEKQKEPDPRWDKLKSLYN